MLFSHGLVLMAVAVARRRRRTGADGRRRLVAAPGALAALALPLRGATRGSAGLSSTKEVYDDNLARVRPYGYFVVGNLVAFAVAVGPATAVALARLRDRGHVGSSSAEASAAVVARRSERPVAGRDRADLAAVHAAGAGRRRGARSSSPVGEGRGWLALQAVTTLALVAFLRSPW